MRLVTFEHGGSVRTGALLGDDRVLDLPAADPTVPSDMVRLLAAGALDRVRGLVARPHPDATLPLADVRLLAPVPNPGKVVGIGYNYRGHQVIDDPQYPDVFAKTANTIVGPGAAILRPAASDEVVVPEGMQVARAADLAAAVHAAGLTDDARDRHPSRFAGGGGADEEELPDGVARLPHR